MGRLFRRRRADELAEIDAEITAFGEALMRHSLVPSAHAGDPTLLADYERALHSYEQAKRDLVGDRDRRDAADVLRALDEGRHALASVDARLAGEPAPPRTARLVTAPKPTGDPPKPTGQPKPPPPFKMWPQNTGKARRAQGQYNGEVTLQRPSIDRPVLLVVRIRYEDRHNLVEMGPPDRRTTLLRSKRQRRVVVPLPASEEREVHLAIKAGFGNSWWAWLQPVDTAPVLRDQLGGEGGYVFRYDGGPTQIRMRHSTPGTFSLTVLTPAFEKGEPLLSGRGDTTIEAVLEGPAYVHVHAEGAWTIQVL
ncbi:hypothetical protein AB0L06_36045 [Spirillospora sp. NPDC052269]